MYDVLTLSSVQVRVLFPETSSYWNFNPSVRFCGVSIVWSNTKTQKFPKQSKDVEIGQNWTLMWRKTSTNSECFLKTENPKSMIGSPVSIQSQTRTLKLYQTPSAHSVSVSMHMCSHNGLWDRFSTYFHPESLRDQTVFVGVWLSCLRLRWVFLTKS